MKKLLIFVALLAATGMATAMQPKRTFEYSQYKFNIPASEINKLSPGEIFSINVPPRHDPSPRFFFDAQGNPIAQSQPSTYKGGVPHIGGGVLNFKVLSPAERAAAVARFTPAEQAQAAAIRRTAVLPAAAAVTTAVEETEEEISETPTYTRFPVHRISARRGPRFAPTRRPGLVPATATVSTTTSERPTLSTTQAPQRAGMLQETPTIGIKVEPTGLTPSIATISTDVPQRPRLAQFLPVTAVESEETPETASRVAGISDVGYPQGQTTTRTGLSTRPIVIGETPVQEPMRGAGTGAIGEAGRVATFGTGEIPSYRERTVGEATQIQTPAGRGKIISQLAESKEKLEAATQRLKEGTESLRETIGGSITPEVLEPYKQAVRASLIKAVTQADVETVKEQLKSPSVTKKAINDALQMARLFVNTARDASKKAQLQEIVKLLQEAYAK